MLDFSIGWTVSWILYWLGFGLVFSGRHEPANQHLWWASFFWPIFAFMAILEDVAQLWRRL